ncbi:MAG: hypothetical protein ACLPID_08665 [Beijerinckiaceae bacterium]
MRIVAGLCILVMTVANGNAQTAGVYYQSRFRIAGVLLRAGAICGADYKRTIAVGLDLIATPELKAIAKAYPDTTQQWMKGGADNFNTGVMTDGLASACAYALTVRRQAEDIVKNDRAAFSSQGETVEQDQIWNDRIEHGACTRLRDRRTDSPADIAECNRDYAMTPMCISYKGFAFSWFDMANDPNPALSSPSFSIANLNTLGSKGDPADPPYYRSPQFRDVLRRLLNITFSPARSKWSTRDQFADYAYRICMDGHPF